MPLAVGRKGEMYKNRMFVAPMHGPAWVDSANMLNDYGIEYYASGQRAALAVSISVRPRWIILTASLMMPISI